MGADSAGKGKASEAPYHHLTHDMNQDRVEDGARGMNPTVELVLKHKKANMRKSGLLMLQALKSAPHLNDNVSLLKYLFITVVCPHTSTQLFGFPMYLLLQPLFLYPYDKTTFAFFGYLFVYLNLVSAYFTHRNITFCLPPFVIIHFCVTRIQPNMFQFTSLAPRSVFVYLAFFLVPHNIFLFT